LHQLDGGNVFSTFGKANQAFKFTLALQQKPDVKEWWAAYQQLERARQAEQFEVRKGKISEMAEEIQRLKAQIAAGSTTSAQPPSPVTPKVSQKP
jgi:hypothetical protein